jgi:hypothetical protein
MRCLWRNEILRPVDRAEFEDSPVSMEQCDKTDSHPKEQVLFSPGAGVL